MGFVTQTHLASKNNAGSNGMECRDVDDYFCDGLCQSEAVIPMDVARHLLRCEVCRALYHRLRSARRVQVPAELQSRILWMIRTSLSIDSAHNAARRGGKSELLRSVQSRAGRCALTQEAAKGQRQ